jgi:hypothetical protein
MTLLRSWSRRLFAGPATRPLRKAPARCLPRLEALEDRLAPAAYHVTSLSDDGSAGTLRWAITQANANPGADTIDFQVSGTISLNGTPLPAFTDAAMTTVTGAVTLDAHGASRILQVSAGASAGLNRLTLAHGSAGDGGAIANSGTLALTGCTLSGNSANSFGGGLFNAGSASLSNCTLSGNVATDNGGGITNTATLTLSACTLTDNSANDSGGGISNGGTLSLTACTLTSNSASNQGGGIASFSGGTLALTNCTLYGNSASAGGGLFNSATAALTNCTLSGNSAGAGGGIYNGGTLDVNNSIVANSLSGGDVLGSYSGGHNLIGDVDGPVALGLLAENGGPTQTMALLDSRAIDTADAFLAPAADQRGVARDAAPDIGAFEAQKPTLTRSLAAVTVNEGSPATNIGTFDDPLGRATVTLTASLGAVTKDDATGTWNWSYTPADGPSGPTTVTITATNSAGLTATATFTLTVNNVAPTASITGLPASGHSPEGTAISLGSAVTDPSSADTAAGFSYAWSVTKNGAAYASGSAATFSFTPDDNGTSVVTLTATDKDGGVSQPASATLTVDNVAPTAGVSGPADGVRGQARTFTLTASDPSGADQAAGFTFAITWGDGTTQTVSGPSGTTVSHVYTASGAYGVQVTATDKDGGLSAAATQAATITAVALQTDPTDPGKTALVVGGTTAADTITIKPADAAGTLDVRIGTTDLGNFKPTGHLIVYGQAGDDTIKLQTATVSGKTVYVSTPAFLFGDDGNDTLNTQGSTANNVLEGGAGNDTLQAGSGRDLLVGGSGADVLHGGGGDDILIGGTTDYDSNLVALNAVMAEWGRTDADYTTRVKHLNGTLGGGANGATLLTATTVHDDAASDTLFGEGGTDWFFALLSGTNKDTVKDQATGEVVTGL